VKHLCCLFGVCPSTAKRYLRQMLKRILKKLKNLPSSRIKFPDENEMAEYSEIIRAREPRVRDVIGFVDGVAIPVQCNSSEICQSIDYNGYRHDTVCNNVFAFSPLGKIIYACINYPGSWHDSQVSQHFISHFLAHSLDYKMCVDQGFPRCGDLVDKFVGPLSKKTRSTLSPILRSHVLSMHNIYVSLRQSSEWGMRGLQGSFSRLKSRLTSNKTLRHKIITSIVLLHNYRTEHVGLNQIATVFNPQYEQYINLEGYDKISRYFDNSV